MGRKQPRQRYSESGTAGLSSAVRIFVEKRADGAKAPSALSFRFCTLRALHALSGEHRAARKESLLALYLVVEIVEEIEIPVAKLEQRNVGRRTHIQRAA